MYENKSSNPFEPPRLSIENLLEDNLDDIVQDIRASRVSFDTWYQVLFKCVIWLMPTIKINNRIIYDVDDDNICYIYIGPHRRCNIGLLTTTLNSIRALTVPRTLKIRDIKEVV